MSFTAPRPHRIAFAAAACAVVAAGTACSTGPAPAAAALVAQTPASAPASPSGSTADGTASSTAGGTAGSTAASDRPSPAPAPGVGADGTLRLVVHFRDRGLSRARRADIAAAAGRRVDAALGIAADRTLGTGATLVRSARAADSGAAERLAAALRADPAVASVEPDRLLRRAATPPDPLYPAQWHYKVPSVERAGLNLPPAWDLARGAGVTVAVLDTGVAPHTDLSPNLVPGYDFISDTFIARDGDGRDASAADPGDYSAPGECAAGDPGNASSWHGTHVAGTVGGAWGNGAAGVGVAHYARLQPVRVLGRCGGYTSAIPDALVWAPGGTVPGVPANPTPAKVINLSLGGSGTCSTIEQSAINAAVSRGTTVVAAAGNSAQDARNFTPASCGNVVTVAALDRQGNRAYYSNFGPAVDVAAPGGETNVRAADGVLSTLNSGQTTPAGQTSTYYQGTSMAAPHVSGVVALVQTKRRLTPAQVELALKNNVRAVPGTCAAGCGRGLVDAHRTVSTTQRTYAAP